MNWIYIYIGSWLFWLEETEKECEKRERFHREDDPHGKERGKEP